MVFQMAIFNGKIFWKPLDYFFKIISWVFLSDLQNISLGGTRLNWDKYNHRKWCKSEKHSNATFHKLLLKEQKLIRMVQFSKLTQKPKEMDNRLESAILKKFPKKDLYFSWTNSQSASISGYSFETLTGIEFTIA